MLAIDKIERAYYTLPQEAQVAVPIGIKHSCNECGHEVEAFHRYCWYCGKPLSEALKKPKKEKEGDAYEIHHSGEPQLQGLFTYGKDAQLIEPRTR
jgi:predicted amidophosphoribosyltransferase